MKRRIRPTVPRGKGLRPHGDLGEPSDLATGGQRDVAHLLLELRTTLDEIPSSSATARARELVRELLAREMEGPSPAGE